MEKNQGRAKTRYYVTVYFKEGERRLKINVKTNH